MEFRMNLPIRILEGEFKGDFRIVSMNREVIFLGVISTSTSIVSKPGKKSTDGNTENTIQLVDIQRVYLKELDSKDLIKYIHVEIPHDALKYVDPNNKRSNSAKKSAKDRHEENRRLIAPALCPIQLNNYVSMSGSFKELIEQMKKLEPKTDTKKFNRLLVKLIKFGFNENSLIPNHYKCGAAGIRRFSIGAKAGSKSDQENSVLSRGDKLPFTQMGWSREWEEKALKFINKYPSDKPHPSIREIRESLIRAYFSMIVIKLDGTEVIEPFPEGTYPTEDQFRNWYKKNITKASGGRNKTTETHWKQNHRRLPGRNADGVGGPGHTYAIDSTIADVNLCSMYDRLTIIGRPIVYFLVDVWSTVKVGYYICLTGPKWSDAVISLFSALYCPKKLALLRGTEHVPILNQTPGLPLIIFSDRGELIAQAAVFFSRMLELNQEFSSPFRGDAKGTIEVQFHKLKQGTNHLEGSHDFSRKERELRKSKPYEATMNLLEFNKYVYSLIVADSLASNVQYHHLTPEMLLEIPNPTPAAVWNWGQENGYGYDRYISESDLIRLCLPQLPASASKHGISVGKHTYFNKGNKLDDNLADQARYHGNKHVDVWMYPGNTQQIWTSNGLETGLRVVQQSGKDTEHLYLNELKIIQDIHDNSKSDHKHSNLKRIVQENHKRHLIYTKANKEKQAALKLSPQNKKQNIKLNRNAELMDCSPHAPLPPQVENGQTNQKVNENRVIDLDGSNYLNSILEDELFGGKNGI